MVVWPELVFRSVYNVLCHIHSQRLHETHNSVPQTDFLPVIYIYIYIYIYEYMYLSIRVQNLIKYCNPSDYNCWNYLTWTLKLPNRQFTQHMRSTDLLWFVDQERHVVVAWNRKCNSQIVCKFMFWGIHRAKSI